MSGLLMQSSSAVRTSLEVVKHLWVMRKTSTKSSRNLRGLVSCWNSFCREAAAIWREGGRKGQELLYIPSHYYKMAWCSYTGIRTFGPWLASGHNSVVASNDVCSLFCVSLMLLSSASSQDFLSLGFATRKKRLSLAKLILKARRSSLRPVRQEKRLICFCYIHTHIPIHYSFHMAI